MRLRQSVPWKGRKLPRFSASNLVPGWSSKQHSRLHSSSMTTGGWDRSSSSKVAPVIRGSPQCFRCQTWMTGASSGSTEMRCRMSCDHWMDCRLTKKLTQNGEPLVYDQSQPGRATLPPARFLHFKRSQGQSRHQASIWGSSTTTSRHMPCRPLRSRISSPSPLPSARAERWWWIRLSIPCSPLWLTSFPPTCVLPGGSLFDWSLLSFVRSRNSLIWDRRWSLQREMIMECSTCSHGLPRCRQLSSHCRCYVQRTIGKLLTGQRTGVKQLKTVDSYVPCFCLQAGLNHSHFENHSHSPIRQHS